MALRQTKVGIIIDSGASNFKTNLKNIERVPLIINEIIDGQVLSYNDGVDLSNEEIYKKIENKAKLSTSQSIFGICHSRLEEMLKKYDQVLIFPLSKGLSGTYNTWVQVVEEFDSKKVILFNHDDVGVGALYGAIDGYNKYMNGNTKEEVQEFLNERTTHRLGTIVINDLDALVRGGRLSSFKGKVAKFLNLKALIAFNGSLNLFGKCTTIESAVNKCLSHIDDTIDFTTKGIKHIFIVTNNTDKKNKTSEDFAKNIIKWLDENKVIGRDKILYDDLPSAISVHTGVNTLTVWIEANW